MQKDTNIDEAISTNQSNTSLALLVGGAVTCIAGLPPNYLPLAISLSSHYFFGRSSIYRHKLTKDVISIEKYMFLLPPKLKKEGIKLVDLNSEDRNILLQAAKLNRSITESVGLHFKNSRYFMSLFLSHVHNYPKTVRFIRTDYLKYNLSRFDVTVVRNIPSDIEKLGMKLNKELKVDSLVITNKFQFPGWSPILTEGETNIYQIGIHQANKSK
ncbi:hypothetical protein BC833DRAFT_566779 [Globomyces pollinis-pini]|nr:hypothetical protein BC833DRAFT_566779 [Globomyces pollinis-pini]